MSQLEQIWTVSYLFTDLNLNVVETFLCLKFGGLKKNKLLQLSKNDSKMEKCACKIGAKAQES